MKSIIMIKRAIKKTAKKIMFICYWIINIIKKFSNWMERNLSSIKKIKMGEFIEMAEIEKFIFNRGRMGLTLDSEVWNQIIFTTTYEESREKQDLGVQKENDERDMSHDVDVMVDCAEEGEATERNKEFIKNIKNNVKTRNFDEEIIVGAKRMKKHQIYAYDTQSNCIITMKGNVWQIWGDNNDYIHVSNLFMIQQHVNTILKDIYEIVGVQDGDGKMVMKKLELIKDQEKQLYFSADKIKISDNMKKENKQKGGKTYQYKVFVTEGLDEEKDIINRSDENLTELREIIINRNQDETTKL